MFRTRDPGPGPPMRVREAGGGRAGVFSAPTKQKLSKSQEQNKNPLLLFGVSVCVWYAKGVPVRTLKHTSKLSW